MYPDIVQVKRRRALRYKPPRIVQLEKMVHAKKPETVQALRSALKQNAILNHLDDYQLNALVEVMKPVRKEQGEMLIEEGTLGYTMYILVNGAVHVSSIAGLSKDLVADEKDTSSSFCLGEVALFYDAERTATITMNTTCTGNDCFHINIDQFYTVMNAARVFRTPKTSNPSITRKTLAIYKLRPLSEF